jgi:hypothetical protein
LYRNLCAGIPAERHGDRAAHELLVAPRLASRCFDLGLEKTRLGIVPEMEPVRRPRVWSRGAASSHLTPLTLICCWLCVRSIGRTCIGVTPTMQGTLHERDESNRVCRRRRIAHSGRPNRRRPGHDVEQPRRCCGGTGRFKVDHDRSGLASSSSSLGPLASTRLAPLIVAEVF